MKMNALKAAFNLKIVVIVLSLLILILCIAHIQQNTIQFLYRSIIADRSLKSLAPSLAAWHPFQRYSSNDKLTILEDNKLPYGNSFNASLIVKHPNGLYGNVLTQTQDRLGTIFNNLTFTRKFYCELDYDTYKIGKECSWMKVHLLLHDGRMFAVDGKLYISFTFMDDNYVQKQSIYDVKNDKIYLPRFNYNNGIYNKEKNWQFFQMDGDLYMIYYVKPFRVYKISKKTFEVIQEVQNLPWKFPMSLRGSAPPVFVGDKFYMVVHSTDYKMYVLTFDKYFRILKVTSKPLCDGHDGTCTYNIYFPCGMIYNQMDDTFLISMGINDVKIGLMKFTKSELDSLLDMTMVGESVL